MTRLIVLLQIELMAALKDQYKTPSTRFSRTLRILMGFYIIIICLCTRTHAHSQTLTGSHVYMHTNTHIQYQSIHIFSTRVFTYWILFNFSLFFDFFIYSIWVVFFLMRNNYYLFTVIFETLFLLLPLPMLLMLLLLFIHTLLLT